MLREPGAMGVFVEPEAAASAIRSLRAAGLVDVRAAMPAPYEQVIEALGMARSRLGIGVFLGVLAGVTCGLMLCILTSESWPLVTGGKPIVSIPAFIVIAFEASVLIGGTFTHALLAYTTATGRVRRSTFVHDPRFLSDRIGVFVAGETALGEELLRKAGAEEVRRV
jgi:hypothetical protein